MSLFEKIKHYYKLGYYQRKHIERLFLADAITREQYNEILGMKRLETEI